ncbi:YihY/virulence factor BrkB family protein [Actinoallomurus sp. CA-150999]|uniref:YihY/virulence factor BrkB family protein n=1 Tax=Actinoallomurus sp. CA-150999 TaxID=3239887 RepID=UPI003D8D28FA
MSEDQRHIRIALLLRRILHAKAMRRAIAGPEGYTVRAWVILLRKVRREAKEDNLPLIAAGVTFWIALSIVPLTVGVIAVCALVITPTQIEEQLAPLTDVLPPLLGRLLAGQARDAAAMSGQGLTLRLIGALAGVLWTCSRAFDALISGLHVVIDEQETRGFVRKKLIALGLAAGALVTVLAAFAIVAAVPHARLHTVDRVLGLGIRFMMLAVLTMAGLILLYRYGPDRKKADWHAVRWGAGIAMTAWLAMSIALAVYDSGKSGDSATYGTLAGAAALASWLYLSMYIILFGAEANAEIEKDLGRRAALVGEQPKEPQQPVPSA